MTNICNMPNATDSKGIFELFVYINNNNCTDGIFFPVVLFVIYCITLFVSYGYNRQASTALIISSFIAFVLAIPLAVMDLLAPKYMYLSLLSLAIGIFWAALDKE